MSTTQVVARITADTAGFTGPVKLASGALLDMQSNALGLSTAMTSMGDRLQATGQKMTLGVTLPLTIWGATALNTSSKFETAMSKTAAAVGKPGQEMTQLSDLAQKMGRDTVYSAGEAADAMVELGKGGFTEAQIAAGGLETTMALAAAGTMEMATAANVTSAAMSTFGISAEDSMSVADALAGAANATQANVSDLALSLSQAGATASIAGQDLQGTTAALGLLAKNGILGSDAGTSLKTMLLNLAPSTKEATETMNKLGVSFVNQDGSFKNMTEIAGVLQTKLADLSESERTTALTTMFGSDAMRAASVLYKEGAVGMDEMTAAVSAQGSAQESAQSQLGSTARALESMRGSFEGVQQVLGDALAPLARTAAAVAQWFANAFSSLPGWVHKAVVTIGVAVGLMGPMLVGLGMILHSLSFVAGPLLVAMIGRMSVAMGVTSKSGLFAVAALQKLADPMLSARKAAVVLAGGLKVLSIAFFTSPWGVAITGVVAFGAALVAAYKYVPAFRDAVTGAWQTIKDTFADLASRLKPALDAIKAMFDDFGSDTLPVLAEKFAATFTVIAGVLTWLVGKWATGMKALADATEAAGRFLLPVFQKIGDVLSWLANGPLDGIVPILVGVTAAWVAMRTPLGTIVTQLWISTAGWTANTIATTRASAAHAITVIRVYAAAAAMAASAIATGVNTAAHTVGAAAVAIYAAAVNLVTVARSGELIATLRSTVAIAAHRTAQLLSAASSSLLVAALGLVGIKYDSVAGSAAAAGTASATAGAKMAAGAAAAGAAIGVGLLLIERQRKLLDEATNSADDFATALAGVGTSIEDIATGGAPAFDWITGVQTFETLEDVGAALEEVNKQGWVAKTNRWFENLLPGAQTFEIAQKQLDNLVAGINKLATTDPSTATKRALELVQAYKDTGATAEALARVQEALAPTIGAVGEAGLKSAEAMMEVGDRTSDLTEQIADDQAAVQDLTTAFDDLRAAMQGHSDKAMAALTADIDYNKQIIATKQAIEEQAAAEGGLQAALNDTATGFNTSTSAGVALAESFKGNVKAANDYITAQVEQIAATQGAAAAAQASVTLLGDQRKALIDTLVAMDWNAEAAAVWVDTLLMTPGEVNTLAQFEKAAAEADFQGLVDKYKNAPPVTLPVETLLKWPTPIEVDSYPEYQYLKSLKIPVTFVVNWEPGTPNPGRNGAGMQWPGQSEGAPAPKDWAGATPPAEPKPAPTMPGLKGSGGRPRSRLIPSSADVSAPAVDSGGFQGVIDEIQGWADNIRQVMDELGVDLGNAWEGIKAVVGQKASEMWANVTGWFSQTTSSVSQGVSDAGAAVALGWDNIKMWVSQKASEMWASVTGWFEQTRASMGQKVTEAGQAVALGWDNIKASVSQKASEIWGNVTGWFEQTRASIAQKMSEAWTAVTSAFDNIKQTASTKASEMWASVSGWFGQTTATIGEKLSQAWQTVTDKFEAIKASTGEKMEQAKGLVSDALEGMKRLFSEAVPSIGAIWDKVSGVVKAPIAAMFGWINDNMIDPLNAVLGVFGKSVEIKRLTPPTYHQGGYTTAVGGEGLALLRGDEFVLNPQATAKYGQVAEAMNAGRDVALPGTDASLGIGGWQDDLFNAVGSSVAGVSEQVGSAVSDTLGSIGSLVSKGARAAVDAVANPMMDLLKGQFGNSWSGNVIIGGMQRLIDEVKKWGSTYDAAQAAAAVIGGNSEAQVANFFKSEGFSDAGIAGAMANFAAESGFNPAAVEPSPGTGIGLAQWSFERADGLRAFATSRNQPWTDIGTQFAWIQQEVARNSSYAYLWAKMKNATDAVAASQDFDSIYEGSGIKGSRFATANTYLEKIRSGAYNAPSFIASGGVLSKPLGEYVISSEFGPRGGVLHGGIDLAAALGSPVYASGDGQVLAAAWNDGYGNQAILDHGSGLTTSYSHMNAILVAAGQAVKAGQTIGQVGSTGDSTGPHLHFEIRQNGTVANPRNYLGFDAGGWLPPGVTTTVNQTGKPEAILTAPQWTTAQAAVQAVVSGPVDYAKGEKVRNSTLDWAAILGLDNLKKVMQQVKSITGGVMRGAVHAVFAGLDALTKWRAEVTDRVNDVSERMRDFGGINSVAPDGERTWSAQDMVLGMTERLGRVRDFTATIDALRGLGLAQAPLQELIAMGPEQGYAAAKAVMEGRDQITAINKVYADMASSGTRFGQTAAGIDTGRSVGEVAGMQSTAVTVQSGAVVINYGQGTALADRQALKKQVDESIREAMKALAAELARN